MEIEKIVLNSSQMTNDNSCYLTTTKIDRLLGFSGLNISDEEKLKYIQLLNKKVKKQDFKQNKAYKAY